MEYSQYRKLRDECRLITVHIPETTGPHEKSDSGTKRKDNLRHIDNY